VTQTLELRIPVGTGGAGERAPGADPASDHSLAPRDRAAPADVTVSGLLCRPHGARTLLVLAHGAGAGMRHPFMERMAMELATRRIATLRYQFPYMETGRKRPDPPVVATATVRAAIAAATRLAPELTLFAGGKSFGGRMTSQTLATEASGSVRGLVFLGFPLHPAGRPAVARAEHLTGLGMRMLFIQGTRDALADLDLVRGVARDLGERATLHVVEGADHSFKVPRRSGRTDDQAMTEIADAVAGWVG
jgi:uncharacterized protein